MSILENEIIITLHPSNYNHYENKGYTIPRVKNKWSKISVPKNSTIIVKVEDIPKESHQSVTKVCDECGKYVPNQKFAEIIRGRLNGDGKDRCKKCSRINEASKRKNKVLFEKSLEHFAIKNNKEYLLDEFSDKNKKKPNEISFGTHDECLWVCSNCSNEYPMRVSTRTTNGANCPFCCVPALRIKIGFNDLWTTHPETAKLLSDPQRGYEISYGSGKKEEFKCKECEYEQKRTVINIVNRGFSCICSDGISYPEKFMMCILNQLKIDFEFQKYFSWSNDKRYDFYIPSLNTIIETHGLQHYENRFSMIGRRTLEEEQTNDKHKMELAKINGVNEYIIIDCRQSSLEYIKNSVINSHFSLLFNLKIINWQKCGEFSCNSLMKEACKLWNRGIESTVEISKILKLERGTIVRYLKRGLELNLCNYDPVKERRKGLMMSNNGKKVVQLSLDGEIIKEWGSISQAENELKISGISSVCQGKRKSAGGFNWVYKNNIIN